MNGLYDSILSTALQLASPSRRENRSSLAHQASMTLRTHSSTCMSPVLLSGLHWEEVVRNIPRTQAVQHLEVHKLCFRSAWHSTGMGGIVLVAVPGGSGASIDGKLSLLLLLLPDRSLP